MAIEKFHWSRIQDHPNTQRNLILSKFDFPSYYMGGQRSTFCLTSYLPSNGVGMRSRLGPRMANALVRQAHVHKNLISKPRMFLNPTDTVLLPRCLILDFGYKRFSDYLRPLIKALLYRPFAFSSDWESFDHEVKRLDTSLPDLTYSTLVMSEFDSGCFFFYRLGPFANLLSQSFQFKIIRVGRAVRTRFLAE